MMFNTYCFSTGKKWKSERTSVFQCYTYAAYLAIHNRCLLQPRYAKCLHHVRTFWNVSSCFKSWQKRCSLSGRRRMEESKHRFTSRVALPAAAARFLHAPLHRQLDRPPTQPPPSPYLAASYRLFKNIVSTHTHTQQNKFRLSHLFNGKQNVNFVVSKVERES